MKTNPFRTLPTVIAVLVLPVLGYHYGLLLGELPVGGDLLSQFVPWRRFALGELAEGRFPWWNPLVFCGTPFAANIQTSLFYPFNILHIIVPDPHRFFAYSVLFHHALAGVAMYIWQRRRGWLASAPQDSKHDAVSSASRSHVVLGCLFCALVWQWSAFLICHTHDGHLIHLRACAWMPLVFWGQDELMRRRSVRGLLSCAVPFALMVLGGHVQVPFYAAYLLLARGFVMSFQGQEVKNRLAAGLRGFGMAIGAMAVAGGLLGFVVLPLQELSANSSARAGGASYELASSDSLPLTHLPLLVAPYLYGDPLSPFPGKKYWGGGTGYHELAAYAGILTLCLIPFAFGRRRDGDEEPDGAPADARERWFWLVVMGIVGALGPAGGLHALAYDFLPGYAFFRVPGRLLLITILGGAVLAGRGLACLPARPDFGRARSDWLRFAPALALLACALTALLALGLFTDDVYGVLKGIEVQRQIDTELEFHGRQITAGEAEQRLPAFLFADRFSSLTRGVSMLAVWAALSVCFVTLAAVWRRRNEKAISVGLRWGALVLLLADLLWFSYRYTGSAPASEAERMSATTIPVLAEHRYPSPRGRILLMDEVVPTQVEIKYQPGLKPNRLMNHGLETVRGYDPIIPQPLAIFANLIHRRPLDFTQGGLLRFGPVEAIAAEGYKLLNVDLLVARHPLDGWEVVWSSDQGPFYVCRNPEPHARAFLVRDKEVDLTPELVTIQDEVPGRFSARVRVEGQESQFAWSQIVYPGWVCTVDGRSHEIEPFGETFLAVSLEPGEHDVVFEYSPTSFQRGLWMTLLTSLALLFVHLRERRRG